MTEKKDHKVIVKVLLHVHNWNEFLTIFDPKSIFKPKVIKSSPLHYDSC